MKIIHTSDWHLGRIFHGVHLTEDQAEVLEQLIAIVKESKPDVVLISGDIYDRAVPPHEAVTLLDEVLSRLVLDCKVSVVIIAGNHDSPDRLNFGSRLLANQGLYIVGSVSSEPKPIVFSDMDGPIKIYTLPYAEPSMVREKLECEDVQDHDSALNALVSRIKSIHSSKNRSILVTHAFVAGGSESDSERPLSVGGASSVKTSSLEGFNYIALGHLHRPQKAGDNRIHYSGSIFKYSFSETSDTKSVNLIEMDGKGNCTVERIPLSSSRDVRCVEGYMEDILKGPKKGASKDDYLKVILRDEGAIYDAMGKLRNVYPNILHIERTYLVGGGDETRGSIDHKKKTEEELFSSFYQQVTEEEITNEQKSAFSKVVNDMHRRDREVPV